MAWLQSLGEVAGAVGIGWRCRHCNQWSNQYTGNIINGTSRCPNCGLDPNPFACNEIAAAPTEPEESETKISEPNIYTPLNPIQTQPDDGNHRSAWTRTEKFGTRPKLKELQALKGQNGMTVRVIEEAAYSWKAVAMALGFSPAQIQNIRSDCLNCSEDACREVFIKWLEGSADDSSPLTWDALIECLKDAKLGDLAESIGHCLSHCQ